MDRIFGFLRQHVIAVLALALVLGGGAAFAAGAKLPKNSVGSKQVKNSSLKGKDLKDGSLTGSDVRDGTLTGTDLADGSVGVGDLAPGVVPRVDLVYVKTQTGQTSTLFTDPLIGTVSLTCNGSANWQVSVQLPSTATPGIAGVVGSDLVDQSPAGGGSISNSTPGGAGGSLSWGGPGNILGHFTAFFDTATKRLHLDADVSAGCVLRGTLNVRDRSGPPVLTRTAAKQAGGGSTCSDVVGDASCSVSRASGRSASAPAG